MSSVDKTHAEVAATMKAVEDRFYEEWNPSPAVCKSGVECALLGLGDLKDKTLIEYAQATAVDLIHYQDPRGMKLVRAYMHKLDEIWVVHPPSYGAQAFFKTKKEARKFLAKAIRTLLGV